MPEHQPRIADSLGQLIARGDETSLTAILRQTPPEDSVRLVNRLSDDDLRVVLGWLDTETIASLLAQLPHIRAAEWLRLMPSREAAAAFLHLPSNDQVDLIAELEGDAAPLLEVLPTDVSRRLLQLAEFEENTAGGLMVTEYLAFRESATVEEVIDDLRANASRYVRLEVQYAYIVDAADRLVGALRLRDLLLLEPQESIRKAMAERSESVLAETPLDQLLRLFDRLGFLALPVVDNTRRLLGVVIRADVEEAVSERGERRFMLMSGVLSGEELRSMPWTLRIARRAPWLAVSLLLSMTAASVIGWYEETLASVISLAVFLPVISGMGGNAGNQSLAVSIREMSLGLIGADEITWVILKEALVAALNGLLMGGLLGAMAFVWQGNLWLSLVVAAAILFSTLLAAILGGIIPLILKRIGWDPALASGPILFTTVDLGGFLFALALADAIVV